METGASVNAPALDLASWLKEHLHLEKDVYFGEHKSN